jgi:hypothetical protein
MINYKNKITGHLVSKHIRENPTNVFHGDYKTTRIYKGDNKLIIPLEDFKIIIWHGNGGCRSVWSLFPDEWEIV